MKTWRLGRLGGPGRGQALLIGSNGAFYISATHLALDESGGWYELGLAVITLGEIVLEPRHPVELISVIAASGIVPILLAYVIHRRRGS